MGDLRRLSAGFPAHARGTQREGEREGDVRCTRCLNDASHVTLTSCAYSDPQGTIGAKKDAKDDTMITLQPAQTEDAKSAEAILQRYLV